MKERIRIVLVDDHALMREGVRMLLESQPEFDIVGEASGVVDGRARIEALQPDIVLVDISMPDGNGAKMTHALRESMPNSKFIILTRHNDQAYLQQAMRAGAKGYVLKKAAPYELLNAIRTVADGKPYVDPSLESEYMGRANQPTSVPPITLERPLSPREEQVLRLIALGHSNQEIAAQLGVSVKTVEYQRAKGMEKLGFKSRVQIVQHAIHEGWLDEA
jgi:DNA-binding NarL/FixJ family response regulator